MATVNVFLVHRNDVWYGYTLSMLSNLNGEIKSQDDALKYAPDGEWYNIELPAYVTAGMDAEVRARIRVMNPDGTTGYNEADRAAAQVDVLVGGWGLVKIDPAWTPTAAGFRMLPLPVANAVSFAINEHVNRGMEYLDVFTKPLSLKSEDGSEAQGNSGRTARKSTQAG